MLRRQNRRKAAVRWPCHYPLAQDPVALGRESAVILESIAQGAFGTAGRKPLAGTLTGRRERLMDSDEAQAKQITRWREASRVDPERIEEIRARWP
ncbi:hypothetical protein GCM10010129_41370 [Streptomyces fumigatiscleroticus]|nr:hypothetical protein GCM10010129_41370 [Streptomyces fumigatiscleroticus]